MSPGGDDGQGGTLDVDAIRWLTPEIARAIHDEVMTPENIAGEDGARPIEGVLGRIEQRAHYGDLSLDALRIAAAYAVAIARAHSFIDGNKRTALVAMETFLELHGYELVGVDQPGLADLMERVASGEADEDALHAALLPHVEAVREDPKEVTRE